MSLIILTIMLNTSNNTFSINAQRQIELPKSSI